MTTQEELEIVPYPSNHQVQDILDEMGMIDENGYCPHTVEEIFRAGIEWLAEQGVSYQTTILENYDGLLITDMEVPSDKFNKGDKVIVQIRKYD